MGDISLPWICPVHSENWLLWSHNLSWDTGKPYATLCLQYTILSWIPLLYLWISSAIYTSILWNRKTLLFLEKGKFTIFKLVMISCLLFVEVFNVGITIGDYITANNPPAILLIQPIISGLSAALLIYMNELTFKKGVHSSGTLFCYWLIQLVCSIIITYSKLLMRDVFTSDNYRNGTSTVTLTLVTVLFLSNCFSDNMVIENVCKSLNAIMESEPVVNDDRIESHSIRKQKPCPEASVSFLSQITYAWFTKYVILGYQGTITNEDLFELRECDTCQTIVTKMEKEWNSQKAKSQNRNAYGSLRTKTLSSKFIIRNQNDAYGNELLFHSDNEVENREKPSFLIALFKTIGPTFMMAGLHKLIGDLIEFVPPQLIGLFISFIENKNEYVWHGYLLVMCLFVSTMLRTFEYQQFYHGCYVTGMRARSAVIGIVYRKTIHLSSASRKHTTVGEIVNLMSIDAQKLQDIPGYIHYVWSSPISITLAVIFLWQQIGASVLAGLGLMICLMPFNSFVGVKVKRLQMQQMKMKDDRIKLMSEILSGIKILKLYAWEKCFGDKIRSIRDKECNLLRSAMYLKAISALSWFCAPFLVTLFSFLVYIFSNPDNVLTTKKAFVCLTLFNMLNMPISMLPETVVCSIAALVSIKRINKFLIEEEIDPENVVVSEREDNSIKVVDGNFSWGQNEATILKDINLEVSEGLLIAVVGTVGSGKSSLINAMLGEMHKISGKVFCRGSVAYVPQQAWCLNASVQDNILFGKNLEEEKYQNIVEACALVEDLKVLPAGDQTEVGERGINLSGGQKQRISIARAVYQNADLYLFDDPLSAVDSHVGKHIFDNVIGPGSMLSNKSRVLVTHSLTWLPKVDNIFVMVYGRISEIGTYRELLNNNGPFSEYIRTYLEQELEDYSNGDNKEESRQIKSELKKRIPRMSLNENSENETPHSKSGLLLDETGKEERESQRKRLIQEETVGIGKVQSGVFLSYLKSATYHFTCLVLISHLLFMSCSIGASVFLSRWSQSSIVNETQDAAAKARFLTVYGSLGLSQTIFVFFETFSLAYGTYLASKSMHNILLNSVLRSPDIFFDTTPVGRILNRIGKDIDTIDTSIPSAIRSWLITAAEVVGAIISVCIGSPFIIIALIPLSIMYCLIQKFYICTNRQLTRIDSIKRSPIYSYFQETIVGVASIRAFKRTNSFQLKCDVMIDENQMVWYPNIVSYRWLQFYLEMIGNLIILLAGIFAVVTRNSIGPGLAGLSLSYALVVTGSMAYMVRMSCDLELNTVAIERIKEYSELKPEAQWDIAETKPPGDWPYKGEIEFRNYSVRYRPELDLVLKTVNLVVHAGEKFGIVGRTGAGKSSLALSLFRLTEAAEGSIYIDGVDISKLGLHDLRSKITIIPQDPVLFSGTLRMNLDPFERYSDSELWTVLESAHLISFVSKIPEGLQYTVSEGGENLSVGQRQLVCLARALLKKSKILVLDEATAAVDLETDDLIQSSIRKQFRSCTVLTIAHRLNTIMDYDRIMVLDQGYIKELGSPMTLLADKESMFYGLAKDAGLVQ